MPLKPEGRLSLSLRLKNWLWHFQGFVSKPWYAGSLGFMAAIDVLILIIPMDGLLLSSTLLAPKKWWRFWLWTAVGSSLGGMIFAGLVQLWGWSFLQQVWPGIELSEVWKSTEALFQSYGLWLLFAVSLAPFVQQPAIALSVLAHHSLGKIAVIMLAGRLIKYFIMTAVARFAPDQLKKLWGVKKELAEVQP